MVKKYASIALVASMAIFSISCGGEKKEADKPAANDVKNEVAAPAKTNQNKVNAAAVEASGDAKFEFDNAVWNFGEIKQGEVVEHVFKFKNVGTEPLIIAKAKGSCGCTAPSYTNVPVAPGDSGEIKVKFNSKGKRNKQNKMVTITANTTPNVTRLRVEGNVLVAAPADNKAKAAQ
jgi:uncharacterized cupredoxin-like copper-binding protein